MLPPILPPPQGSSWQQLVSEETGAPQQGAVWKMGPRAKPAKEGDARHQQEEELAGRALPAQTDMADQLTEEQKGLR